MSAIVADTQAIVWFLTDEPLLSPAALTAFRAAINVGDPIYIASISLVEVTYLVEKGKLLRVVLTTMRRVLSTQNSDFELVPLDFNVARALEQIPRDIVPDMPDRIIAATALHLNLSLVTSDHKIQASPQISTIW